MQSSMAVAGIDALSESCENILTRRANQRHYSIIAQFAKRPWPCPTAGSSSAIAGKKSLPTIRSCTDSPQRRGASRVADVNWVLRTGKKSGGRPSGGTGGRTAPGLGYRGKRASPTLRVPGLALPCAFEQEPGAPLGLVDPVFQQACRGNVACLIAQQVCLTHAAR